MEVVRTDDKPHSVLSWERTASGALLARLAGSWTIGSITPSISDVLPHLTSPPAVQHLAFDTQGLTEWDTSLLPFLLKLAEACVQHHITVHYDGLPQGVQRLLRLATAVPERQGARRQATTAPFLVRIGNRAQANFDAAKNILEFVGQTAIAFSRLLIGQARFRRSDFFLTLQECGAQALPIVSLISFLVGLILAFVGAVQLKQFGAHIYVANLVGLGMAREMGAMMTGIIMAGRTGAAFAAQLGTMTVNEEIDALSTSGLSPVEFLVLPRMLALVLMVPLLCIYADLLGILGGAFVTVGMFDVGLLAYYHQTVGSLDLMSFILGLIKGAVFGVLVALAGCLRGMQCGRSAAAVGEAATSAVVTAIVWIIVSDATLTVIYEVLGV